jgi:hypothetical protein
MTRGEGAETASAFVGSWRITAMEVWDRDAVDLLGPGYMKFDDEGLGDFRFIAVQGSMHCFFDERDRLPFVEFSWRGDDDGTETCGRGWARVEKDGVLRGRIFLHQGDNSAFEAVRWDGPRREPGLAVGDVAPRRRGRRTRR